MLNNASESQQDKLHSPPKLRNQTAFVNLSIRIFGRFFLRETNFKRATRELSLAKIPLTVREFLSTAAFSTLIFALALFSVMAFFSIRTPHYAFLLLSVGFLASIAFLAIFLEIPNFRSRFRARDINAKLPVGIAFVATLASANVSVDEIIHELGEAQEFGEIARESKSISVSSRFFGKDILTAIREAAASSPSPRFSDFLQGIVTTVTTGGNLKQYFTTKSREYYSEQENQIRRNSESVGIMAESYITVGVAFPLILMIILGVVGALSPVSSNSIIYFLYFTALLLIPVIAAFFLILLRSTLKEVET